MRITARPRVGGRRAAAVSAVTARPPAGWGGVAPYGRAGCLPGGWSLVGGTSRLYRVLCVLRPLLAQVPAAAAHAAPFSRRARRFAVCVVAFSFARLPFTEPCGVRVCGIRAGVPHTPNRLPYPGTRLHGAWRLVAHTRTEWKVINTRARLPARLRPVPPTLAHHTSSTR